MQKIKKLVDFLLGHKMQGGMLQKAPKRVVAGMKGIIYSSTTMKTTYSHST